MEQIDADSVQRLIDDLDSRYPGTQARLCQSDGSLRPLINVFVDGTNTRNLQGLETKLRDGAEVHIIPAVAGGSSFPSDANVIEFASLLRRTHHPLRGPHPEGVRGSHPEEA